MLSMDNHSLFIHKKIAVQRPLKKQNHFLRLCLLASITILIVSSLLIIIISDYKVDDFEKIAIGGILVYILFASAQILGLLFTLFIGVIYFVSRLLHAEMLKNEFNKLLNLDFVGFIKIVSPVFSLLLSTFNIYIYIIFVNVETAFSYLLLISAVVILVPFILFQSLILGIIAKLTNPRLLGNIVLMNSILGIVLFLVGFIVITCVGLSYFFGAPTFLYA